MSRNTSTVTEPAEGDAPRTNRGAPKARDSMPSAGGVTRSIPSARLRAIFVTARLLNPLMRRLAGRRWFPLFAIVHHHGRRSGRAYATPTAARHLGDDFVIPLTFGQDADWYKNVRAAGSCVVQWRGVRYLLVEPEVVDLATARSAFSSLERRLIPLLGITWFVRLRVAREDVDAGDL